MHPIYLSFAFIFCLGLFIILTDRSYWRKLIGLGIFQTSVLIFFIAIGKLKFGTAPFLSVIKEGGKISSPIPHVLMLTAIVVGLATLTVGIALLIEIKKAFNTVDELELNE